MNELEHWRLARLARGATPAVDPYGLPEPVRREAEHDPVFSKWFWELYLGWLAAPHVMRDRLTGHVLLKLKERA